MSFSARSGCGWRWSRHQLEPRKAARRREKRRDVSYDTGTRLALIFPRKETADALTSHTAWKTRR